MSLKLVYLLLLSLSLLIENVIGQFSFEFMQPPIADTVKFQNEYDFIIIGAGSGEL